MWDANSVIGQMPPQKCGVSIIFVNSNREVLLFLRDDKDGIPFPNMWDLLGGNVESGESPEHCIVREMKEEIEMDLASPALFNVYPMSDRIEYVFWQRADIDIAKTPLHEGQKLKWFSLDEIKMMSSDGLAFQFRQILLDFFFKTATRLL
jgi:8-oxo-dGTP diphosphatase